VTENKTNHSSWHPDDDACFDLILGLLPEVEASSVLGHLENCLECEERFRQMAAEWEGLSVHPGETSAARADERTQWWRTIALNFGRPRTRFAVAAGLAAILVFMLLPETAQDPNRRFLGKLPALGTEMQQRAGDADVSGEFSASLESYDRGDFDAAAGILRDTRVSGPAAAFRDIYLASALAWTGAYGAAVEVLETVPFDLVPEPWSGEARWTLFVALRGAGHDARADSLLREMERETGVIGERARGFSPEQK
jgi:hypothetical protein